MEPSLSTDDVIEDAHSLSLVDFVARYPGLYLLTGASDERVNTGFRTDVVDPTKSRGSRARAEVIPVAKASGNPYPDRVSVGRAGNCDISLRRAGVSKLHAHLLMKGGKVQVVDLGSKNGTRVNGEVLERDRPRTVGVRDVIQFGPVQVLLLDAEALFETL
jgi:hypothetical protein